MRRHAIGIAAAIVIVVMCIPASGQQARTPARPVSITAVVDGQTVDIAGVGPTRLWGVRAPETGEYGAEQAKQELQRLVAAPVRLEERAAGVVLLLPDGSSVNDKLLASGWCRNGLTNDDLEFSEMERAAQTAMVGNRGLWGPRPAEGRAPGVDASATSDRSRFNAGGIRAKCAQDWPTDFRMRAYCEQQQQTAVGSLGARSMRSTDQQTIRTKCASDWPDDFRMRDYCEQQQLKALSVLGR
jgi:endonuclease YncB( thermonuclease family)